MAAPISSKVLVFGATGVIGSYIIQELQKAQPSFEKLGLFTSPATAKSKSEEIKGWKGKGVDVIIGDVNSEEDVKKAYEGTQFHLVVELHQIP